jgi:hypothetical protein
MGTRRLGENPTVEFPARLNLDLTTFEYIFNLVKRLPSSNFKLRKSTAKDKQRFNPSNHSGFWSWAVEKQI